MATKTDYGVDKQFFIWAWESSDGPDEVDPDVKKQALKMLEDMIAGKKVKFPTKEST